MFSQQLLRGGEKCILKINQSRHSEELQTKFMKYLERGSDWNGGHPRIQTTAILRFKRRRIRMVATILGFEW